MTSINLTAFSPGSGCGCKISPKDLRHILELDPGLAAPENERLLVGNQSSDDAAVYDMGNGEALISTTDFFTPIVNDPELFGTIASVNAISDVYAMGGRPLMAIAILGWPLKKLPADVAKDVIKGARKVCAEVGIPLAGGHSIDISEPIFGLAVTGSVRIERIKRNDTARAGAKLFLTKPLGVGILTTAEKKGLLKPEHAEVAVASMTKLNTIGLELAKLDGVQAMTDVTGFGLLGHLMEMCEGSGVGAIVESTKVPVIDGLDAYIAANAVPGGTGRNFASYGEKVSGLNDARKAVLCDPQTSGGLLVAVAPQAVDDFLAVTAAQGLSLICFGELVARDGDAQPVISVA